MQIQLMRCTAEDNRIDKRNYIYNVFALEGELKEDTSIMNPVVTIEKNTNPVNTYYNYMYIPEFQRYYFIDDIKVIYEKFWAITGREDVLMSNMADILNNVCIIDKSEQTNNANLYINDGSFVMDSRKYNQVFHYPNGLASSGANILIVAGGGGNNAS